MYDTLKRFITCLGLSLLVCLIIFCSFKYFTSTNDARSQDVNSTIQHLTTDGDRATGAVTRAATGLSEAQDTVNRISERVDESASVLDRLQAELNRIAEANGLTE